MWLAVALPIVATDALFIKLHPLVVVARCLGWLTRLGVTAVSVGVFEGITVRIFGFQTRGSDLGAGLGATRRGKMAPDFL